MLPPEAIEQLEVLFGERFSGLPELERLILVIAATEDFVDHKRVRENRVEHSADISKALSHLSKEGFLRTFGSGRGTGYYLPNSGHENILVNYLDFDLSSLGLQDSSLGLQDSSLDLDSQEAEISKPAQTRKKLGRPQMEEVIVRLCGLRPQSIEKLSQGLSRSTEFLRSHYMKQLVNRGLVVLLYPDKPQHPQQAYLTPELRDKIARESKKLP